MQDFWEIQGHSSGHDLRSSPDEVILEASDGDSLHGSDVQDAALGLALVHSLVYRVQQGRSRALQNLYEWWVVRSGRISETEVLSIVGF